jgi:predicted ATP-grasp superfamily ATP-dependent carboligase
MKLGAFEIIDPIPELKEPHALVMLQPWVDVGSVGTLTLSWLETQFQAQQIAKLARPGDFFDFTRYRPTIYLKDGQRQVSVPNAYVTCSKRNKENDFLFFHLLEPHSHGEMYVEAIVRLLVRLHVKRYCTIGSMYDFVPHTRPLMVTGRASGGSAKQDLDSLGIEANDYQGPTAITTLITQRTPELGIETMSLMVHLPQYTQMDDDYMGASRLMEVLDSIYGFPPDLSYHKMAEQQLKEISTAIENNPQLKAVVEQLEVRYDAQAKQKKEGAMPKLSPEVERFLTEIEKRFRED